MTSLFIKNIFELQPKSGQMDRAHGIVKTFFGDRKIIKLACIKWKSDIVLCVESEIANPRKEYLEHLYGEEKDLDVQMEEKEED